MGTLFRTGISSEPRASASAAWASDNFHRRLDNFHRRLRFFHRRFGTHLSFLSGWSQFPWKSYAQMGVCRKSRPGPNFSQTIRENAQRRALFSQALRQSSRGLRCGTTQGSLEMHVPKGALVGSSCSPKRECRFERRIWFLCQSS